MSLAAGSKILCILHIIFMDELRNSRRLSQNSQKQRQTKNAVTEQVLYSFTLWKTQVKHNNNNNNNLLTASGLSPGGSGYFTFKLRQTY
jgi:hypothetical protein